MMEVFWIHVGITAFLMLCGPLAPALYLSGVAVFYSGRWVIRTLGAGRRHKWFPLARRLAFSLALSIVLGALVAVVGGPVIEIHDRDARQFQFMVDVFCVTVVSFPHGSSYCWC